MVLSLPHDKSWSGYSGCQSIEKQCSHEEKHGYIEKERDRRRTKKKITLATMCYDRLNTFILFSTIPNLKKIKTKQHCERKKKNI